MSKRLLKKDIGVTVTYNGGWQGYRCEAYVNGQLEWHRYFGYTKKDAIDNFYRRYN